MNLSSPGVKPAPCKGKIQRLCHPDCQGSGSLMGSNPLKFARPQSTGIKGIMSELMTKGIRNIPSLLRSTRPVLAATVIDDGKDLTAFDFTSCGNHRHPNPQLHRRAAGSDQGFERGSQRFARNDWSGSHDPKTLACSHFATP